MAITIAEFAKKLGEAGVYASKACEEYADHRLEDAFDKDENGNMVPKMRKVTIFGQEIEIPQVALLSERRLDVDKLDFEFEANVLLDKKQEPRLADHLGLFKRGVKVKAHISFKAGDSLETLELMREQANRRISEQLAVTREDG